MTSYVAKVVGKRILGETVKNKFGSEDPYFETVPATRLDGRPNGKTKRRRKALPPGLSEHDGKVLTKVKRRAYRLDMSLFNCCGIRFGWGSALGLIPFIGDAMDSLLALMVLHTCREVEGGLPTSLEMHMMMNIVFDFAIGIVPFVGDIADAVYKANTRNAALLEKHLREKGRKQLRRSGQPVPAIDPSDPIEFDKTHGPVSPEPVEHQPARNGVMSAQPPPYASHAVPSEPEEARVRENRSWFGRSKARPNDEEMGQADPRSNNASQSQRAGRR